MSDNETPEGIRLLYDLLVKASEYPGETVHNTRNLYNWGEKIKALHHLLSSYHDEDYRKEYQIAMKRIAKYQGTILHPDTFQRAMRFSLNGLDPFQGFMPVLVS